MTTEDIYSLQTKWVPMNFSFKIIHLYVSKRVSLLQLLSTTYTKFPFQQPDKINPMVRLLPKPGLPFVVMSTKQIILQ